MNSNERNSSSAGEPISRDEASSPRVNARVLVHVATCLQNYVYVDPLAEASEATANNAGNNVPMFDAEPEAQASVSAQNVECNDANAFFTWDDALLQDDYTGCEQMGANLSAHPNVLDFNNHSLDFLAEDCYTNEEARIADMVIDMEDRPLQTPDVQAPVSHKGEGVHVETDVGTCNVERVGGAEVVASAFDKVSEFLVFRSTKPRVANDGSDDDFEPATKRINSASSSQSSLVKKNKGKGEGKGKGNAKVDKNLVGGFKGCSSVPVLSDDDFVC